MINKLPFIIIFGMIIGLFIFSLFNQNQEVQKTQNNPKILLNEKNQPLLATGNCNQDSECFTSGCENKICTNHTVKTDCPKTKNDLLENYTCGCIKNRCVWYK